MKENDSNVFCIDSGQLALQARIATSVVLDVTVRPDGSVDSVALVNGHPMLNGAAMESAKQTTFQCNNCREPSTLYHITYKFELGEAAYCKEIDANGHAIYDASADTQVSQEQDTINVVGHPSATCDPIETITFLKFRAAKCLYLWHCGKQRLQ